MTPERAKELFRLAITSVFPDAKFDNDDEPNDDYDETGRPRFILCDEIWDILAEAGHGAEVIIHGEKPETLYYNDFATQTDNVRFMNHISEAMDNGFSVTVNGTDIYDLY